MSKNEEFIKEYLDSDDYYDGVVIKIDERYFNQFIEQESAKSKPAYQVSSYNEHFDSCDVSLHPLQKIYVITDYTRSYDNGAFEFEFDFAFKYKGRFYLFHSEGGN